MKKINSMLTGIKNMPLANYGMKMLFIPCLIAVLSLSAFKGKEIQKESAFKSEKGVNAFTDVYALGSVGPTFTDLNGVEYCDFWVEFFDENFNYVTVYDITLNYTVWITPTVYGMDSKLLSGSSSFLVLHDAPLSENGYFYSYEIAPGTGYTLYQ